jgi:Domain of unknown function (DUF5916)/Carbohydrate family 9 binding domain-like
MAVWALLALGAPLGAQEGAGERASRPAYRVERAYSPITVDGALDEPAWGAATVVELAYETRPAENEPPAVRTQALLTYDDRHLYVGFRAHDPDPSAIRAHLTDRDSAFSDDFVGIVLDTFNDERRAFEFFVNPLGVQMDMFNDDVGGNEDESWDAIWDSAGRIGAEGYVVEIAIPWSSLRFPRTEGEQTWGFDALRFYPRSQRHRISSHPLDRNVTCYLCQASKMTGFAGITPGRNVEVTPTLTGIRTDRREDFPRGGFSEGEADTELGVTGRWGITPNLALNVALNPDFSQVEADAAQLDVNNQFALFFPEKRPFFLEGADFFTTPFNAVFTRNVADPSWGLKLTGKEGRNAVGVFVAEDERTNLILPGSQGSSEVSLVQPSTDAVVRLRRDFGASSAFGVLLTGREGDGYSNRLGGFDGLYRITQSDSIRLQLLRSRTDYPSRLGGGRFPAPRGPLDGHAAYLAYDHNSRNWNVFGRYEEVGEGFRADMGFLPKVDYELIVGGLERTWYGDGDDWLTSWSVGADWDQTRDQGGRLLERETEVTVEAEGPRQLFAFVQTGWRDRAFNGVTFDERYWSAFGEMDPTGDLYLSFFVRQGDEIDFANTRAGEILQLESSLRYDFGLHLRARISHILQRLDVPGGRLFEANLAQASLVYQFTVRTFLRAILQYTDVERAPGLYLAPVDASTERLFSQFLFSYKLNPQTVFFAGYSDNALGDERIDLTRQNRTLFLKLGYAWLP